MRRRQQRTPAPRKRPSPAVSSERPQASNSAAQQAAVPQSVFPEMIAMAMDELGMTDALDTTVDAGRDDGMDDAHAWMNAGEEDGMDDAHAWMNAGEEDGMDDAYAFTNAGEVDEFSDSRTDAELDPEWDIQAPTEEPPVQSGRRGVLSRARGLLGRGADVAAEAAGQGGAGMEFGEQGVDIRFGNDADNPALGHGSDDAAGGLGIGAAGIGALRSGYDAAQGARAAVQAGSKIERRNALAQMGSSGMSAVTSTASTVSGVLSVAGQSTPAISTVVAPLNLARSTRQASRAGASADKLRHIEQRIQRGKALRENAPASAHPSTQPSTEDLDKMAAAVKYTKRKRARKQRYARARQAGAAVSLSGISLAPLPPAALAVGAAGASIGAGVAGTRVVRKFAKMRKAESGNQKRERHSETVLSSLTHDHAAMRQFALDTLNALGIDIHEIYDTATHSWKEEAKGYAAARASLAARLQKKMKS